MKKYIIAFFQLLLFPVLIVGQTKQEVLLHYSEDDFEMITENGLSYVVSSNYSITHGLDTLSPELPLVDVYVLIGPNEEYSSHVIETRESIFSNNVTIVPNELPSTSVHSVSKPNKSVIYSGSSFPSKHVEYTGTHEMGGYRFLSFLVCPFRYDVATRNLYLMEDISICLSLTNSACSKTKDPNQNLRHSLEKIVINKNDFATKYEESNNIARTAGIQQCEYLIITCDSLKNEFQRLASWKTTKGVKASVISVEHIDSCVTGARQQLKIKQAIKNTYDNSNHALKYVLLGGDCDIVPAELCYAKAACNGDTIERYIPCNLFYGSFTDMNWDTDGDGKIGELEDHIDLTYDVIVTRLSASNALDAKTQIDRIIEYEKNPCIDNWENKILNSGTEMEGSYLYDGVYMSDTHFKCEHYLYNKYIRDNWSGIRYMFYDTGTSFEGGSNYNFNLWNLNNQLSNRYTFANVTTHGDFDRWAMEYQAGVQNWYGTANADTLRNSGNTIVVTAACHTNDFGAVSTCLSESFMRNPLGGIIAFYGSSKEGFHSTSKHGEGHSGMLNGLFFKHLLTDDYHQLGRASYDSKLEKIGSCENNNSFRFLMFGLNLLGDPEMPVYLSTPAHFGNVNYSLTDSTLTVNSGLADCRICITSKNDNGETYYNRVDSIQSISINISPNQDYRTCVTKYGYTPFILDYSPELYIQNETINNDLNILANKVYIGSNVNQNEPTGPVNISSGNTRVQFYQEVVITNDFVVDSGSELVIRPGN